MAEMKVYQREHFERKIRDLLSPEIEKEEMLLSSTIADMTESAEKNLAKKIGADKIINELELAAHPEALPSNTNLLIVFLVKIKNVFWYWYCKKDGAAIILFTGSFNIL